MEYKDYVDIREKSLTTAIQNDTIYKLVNEYCTDYGHTQEETVKLLQALPALGMFIQQIISSIFDYYDKKFNILKVIDKNGSIVKILRNE
jgi:hypothetical protein